MKKEKPKTNSDNILNLFNEKDRLDLIKFSFSSINFLRNPDQLIGVLNKSISFLRSQYQDKNNQDIRRKVNEELYLRHVLKTAVLASEIYEGLSDEERGKLDYQVLIYSALLHDVIEVKRENGEPDDLESLRKQVKEALLEDPQIDLIFDLVRILTPEKKQQKDSNPYLQRKRNDFLRIWNESDENKRRYLRVIKSADVLANLEETVIDLESGRENGQMKPLILRYQVFNERMSYISSEFEQQEFLLRGKDYLRRMYNFCPNLQNFTYFILENFSYLDEKGIKVKYVIEGDNIIIAEQSSFDHQNMTQSKDNLGGVVVCYKICNNVFIDFERTASSVEPDEKGKRFFELLKTISREKIKILTLNPNSPLSGLSTYE